MRHHRSQFISRTDHANEPQVNAKIASRQRKAFTERSRPIKILKQTVLAILATSRLEPAHLSPGAARYFVDTRPGWDLLNSQGL